MLNQFKKIISFFVVFLLIICPSISFAWHDYTDSDGGWDYHGSGRDHPYSYYIDRRNYVGPADYASIPPDYIEGPLVLSNAPVPAGAPLALPPQVPAEEFVVNIPNVHGGYNSVVIKRSGEGFVGPQGEYYPEFPKIFQLQMKYGN